MRLEDTKDEIYKKKIARSEIRTSDLSFRSAAPITARTQLSWIMRRQTEWTLLSRVLKKDKFVKCAVLTFHDI